MFCKSDPGLATNPTSQVPLPIFPGITATVNVPNIFYLGHKWLNIFGSSTDIGDFLQKSILEATGGGQATDEAGAFVCNQKYGSAATISYVDPPKPLPPRTQDFTTHSDAACDPLTTLDVDAPAGLPTVPTQPPVPSNPPPSSNPNNGAYTPSTDPNDACVGGYRVYTMEPC
jgi:hypothetical protein